MNETNVPITDICLVTKPNNVPTGYQCIRKTYDDTAREADLMADSFLERKDRYLCITRSFLSSAMATSILEDIKLINERDNPPPNYEPIHYTRDTRDKATAKRLICIKMAERQVGSKCVCDILFLCRGKRPPQTYTLIGEINGLQMCVKEGSVPPMRAPPTTPSVPSNIYPDPMSNRMPSMHMPQSQQSFDGVTTNTLTKKMDDKEILDGIPFEINPKYMTFMNNKFNADDLSGSNSLNILTAYDIEQHFRYDFTVERSAL